MNDSAGVFLGKGDTNVHLLPRLANRHGLIAGATGTGKTVTLQILAEGFSHLGVPVFMADIKGDLSGISYSGDANPKLQQRAQLVGLEDYTLENRPTVFWDLYGEQGHSIRTTISDMGPLLLSRLLELNDTQEGVVNLAFKLADDEGLLLLDLKDFRAVLKFVADQASEIGTLYGHVSKASVGAIQRRLLVLEQQGGEFFFGEPVLDLHDIMRTDATGQGLVNILAADKLMNSPKLYATFLLWLLAELFEQLPEVGDPDKPTLVFFFDEAHLLFDDAPKALVDKVEQVVRLIRSKGVGIYFVTQNPMDIPDAILGQLGNRVQHALRAFTPRDQKAVRAAAETLRSNPNLNVGDTITELAVGEALVSTLDAKGIPNIVQRVMLRPPASRLGPISDTERSVITKQSPIGPRYDTALDRNSAYEMLAERAKGDNRDDSSTAPAHSTKSEKPERGSSRKSSRQGVVETMLKSVVRSVGSGLGRQIVRGILGSILKGR